ncbi:hypothetical protein BD410DRAFT_836011 [Rickenella mellea]|uniref:Acid protease n=1 Tax=Rickenella mellea TaxID=50990 RepID=A0A4Y7QI53_9AGAM|nr:hypothetical protein BD410DRAFT_836011 [Rickenella mellea]
MSPTLKIPLALNHSAMDASFVDPLGLSQDRYNEIWDSLHERGIVKKKRKVLQAELAQANVTRKWLGYTAIMQTKNETGQVQNWTLMVDTGSGLTWVDDPTGQKFHLQAPSSKLPASAWNGMDFKAKYSRGSASGKLRDVFEVLIGHDPSIITIHKQVIGVAAGHSIGDIGANGILGYALLLSNTCNNIQIPSLNSFVLLDLDHKL